MIFLLASAVTSLASNLMSAAFPSVSAQDLWRTEPPMHYARAAHAVVGDGESLFALAGTGAGGAPVLVFERFDGNNWRDEGRIPGRGLNAPAAVALNGKIYLIGGFETDTNVPSAGMHVYNTTTKTWSEYAIDTKGNFEFEREVRLDRSVSVIDLRRKR
jgi:N-acetylneuraminic acid mutarotase